MLDLDVNERAALVLILCLLSVSCTIEVNPVLAQPSGSWASEAPMPTVRRGLGVAAVNGKIYAIGGFPDVSVNEEYDISTNTWTTKAAMPTPRHSFAIAVYQNKIYCIGGMSNNLTSQQSSKTGAIEVYDPATDMWQTKKPIPITRMQLEANVVNGKIYLIGGRTGGQYSTLSLNEVYDPTTETWATKTPMPYPVIHYASAVVDNKIYVIGGQDEFNGTMNLAVNQIYDVETDTWSFGAPLPSVVWISAAGATSGIFAPKRIYVIGGQPDKSLGSTNITRIYNPEDDSWSDGASMPTARFGLGVAVWNDTLYAVGGTAESILWRGGNSENEMYNPIGFEIIQPSPSGIVQH